MDHATNNSGTTFANANAQLVAGDVNVVGSEAEWWQIYNVRRNNANVLRAGVEASGREQLADYYVYPLAEATTIANNQTKQVSFLSAERVRASRGYEQTFYSFFSQDEPVSAEVRVRFSNSQASGLGDQLPSGVVRVYARDARGQPQFVGEDRIGHTSAGSDLALKIGDAFDVTIQPTLRQTTRASRRATDYDMSYLVRNARSKPITVTLRQDSLWRFNEVSRAVDRGTAHRRRQLRLGRAGARERRDGAHVHGSPELVSAARASLFCLPPPARCCRRARRTRSPCSRRARTPSR